MDSLFNEKEVQKQAVEIEKDKLKALKAARSKSEKGDIETKNEVTPKETKRDSVEYSNEAII